MLFTKNILISFAVFYTSQVIAQGTAATLSIPNSKIAWKNQYPTADSLPTPKPEWLALVKDDPLLKVAPNLVSPDGVLQNPTPGNNTYCNWSWGGCVRPTDIIQCNDPKIWGASFDDGPYEITRELLTYLKSINRKVTFFVVGKQVIAWPEILKEAYDQGHEIAIHTWDHKQLTTISNELIIGELKWTELAIKEVLGVTPRLMRPPTGDIDDRVRYIVKQLGYVPAIWTVDSQDWKMSSGAQTEAGVIGNVTQWMNALPNAKHGNISLMHDLTNTLAADLKALPILHSHVQISPVGECAGWVNASYQEQLHASVVPAASQASRPTTTNAVNRPVNDASPSTNSILYTTFIVSLTAFMSCLF